MHIISYVKENDEFIKPLFRKGMYCKYVERYNFETPTPIYYRKDFVSGMVETNLPGMSDLVRQSREMAMVLKELHGAYYDETAKAAVFTNMVHLSVDGAVKSFDLNIRPGFKYFPEFRRKVKVLRAVVDPSDRRLGRSESFSMWYIPLRDYADAGADSEMRKFAKTSPEYSTIPLSGEYCLFLGSLQCTLTNVAIRLNNGGL